MSIEIYLILLIAAFVVVYLVAPQVAGTYLKFRGKRVITCPETRKSKMDRVYASNASSIYVSCGALEASLCSVMHIMTG